MTQRNYAGFYFTRMDIPGAPNEKVCAFVPDDPLRREWRMLRHEIVGVIRRKKALELNVSVFEQALAAWPEGEA